VHGFVKRRTWPESGSIPDVLDMFRCELRFYREIAPVLGDRVPDCCQAEETAGARYWCSRTSRRGSREPTERSPPACCPECTGGGRARRTGAGHGVDLKEPPLTWWRNSLTGPGRNWPRAEI